MSQSRTYPISCPKCGHKQEVELYDAINVQAAPELKEDLLANRLNCVVCESCAFSFRVDKELLYNDPELRLLIYWFPAANAAVSEDMGAFEHSVQELSRVLPDGVKTPNIQMVTRRTELVERLFIAEEDLDARIIEYIKYTIYSQNVEKLNPAEKSLLFDAEDSTEDKLIFVIQDDATKHLEGLLEYERDAYRALTEMFDDDEETANLLEMFPGPYISAQAQLLKEARESQTPPR